MNGSISDTRQSQTSETIDHEDNPDKKIYSPNNNIIVMFCFIEMPESMVVTLHHL